MKKLSIFIPALLCIVLVGCSTKERIYYPSVQNEKGSSTSSSSSTTKDFGSPQTNANAQKATMRPYQVNGKWYYPTTVAIGEQFDGYASWYGEKFHGKKTSNGEIYSMHKHTAAHKTLPMNTIVRVTSLENGKSTIVRINDRGPFVAGRIIDLSNVAAHDIDMVAKGTARVNLEVIGFDGSISDNANISSQVASKSEFQVKKTQQSVQLSAFLVQIGAFRKEAGAKMFASQNQNLGYKAVIREFDLDGSPIYRVMLSGFLSEDEARDFVRQKHFGDAFIVTE